MKGMKQMNKWIRINLYAFGIDIISIYPTSNIGLIRFDDGYHSVCALDKLGELIIKSKEELEGVELLHV